MSEIARPHHYRGWLAFLKAWPLLFLVACGETPVQPEPEPEPEPDLSIGKVLYTCGWGLQGRPATPRVIVDLVVFPANLEDSWRPWPVRAEDEARVLARGGGRILHRFNANMLRMDLATDSLPFLIDSMPVASYALTVPDTLRTDYEAMLLFDHTVTPQDSIAIRRLGGWAKPFVTNINPGSMLGAIPDSIVPALRELGLIELVAGPNPVRNCW